MIIPGAGELKTRISIRTWDEVPNQHMGTDPSFGLPIFVWAKVTAVSGGLYYGSQQVEEAITHRIIIRTGPEITARHIIETSTHRYRIRRSNPIGDAPHFTVIEVEEIGKVG